MSNHALGDCLRPYRDFLSLWTFVLNFFVKPSGGYIYNSSSKFPLGKTSFTFNYCKDHSQLAAIDKRTLTMFSLVI